MANGNGNGYRKPRIYAAGILLAVLVIQSLASIWVPNYQVTEGTLLIELLFIGGLLGLEAWDLLRSR